MNPARQTDPPVVTDALKPCPFCGSTQIKLMLALRGHWVGCLICTGTGPNTTTPQMAVTAWNRRSLESEVYHGD